MELALEPEIYAPILHNDGNYVDKIPSSIKTCRLRCPCSIRKDKSYNTHASFAVHIKSKTHAKWLETINNNKQNYFEENVRLNDVIQTQKMMIAKYERDIQTKIFTIDLLTQQINTLMNGEQKSPNPFANNIDLLDF